MCNPKCTSESSSCKIILRMNFYATYDNKVLLVLELKDTRASKSTEEDPAIRSKAEQTPSSRNRVKVKCLARDTLVDVQ